MEIFDTLTDFPTIQESKQRLNFEFFRQNTLHEKMNNFL